MKVKVGILSKLIKDMIGEYIFVSTNIYPPTAIWYKDKKVVKTEPIDDIIEYSKKILKMMKVEECHHLDFITNKGKDYIDEVVLTEKGISRYSISQKFWKKEK